MRTSCRLPVPVDRVPGVNFGFDNKDACSDVLSGFNVRGLMVEICKPDEQEGNLKSPKSWNTKPATFSTTTTLATKPADDVIGLGASIAVAGIACSGLKIMRFPGGIIADARKSNVLTHL